LQRLAEDELRELEEVAYEIRRLTVELVAYGQWGHIGGSISMAELLAVLYWRVLDINPKDPSWEKRDRLVLSKAHTSPGLYAALALRGFYDIEAIYGYADMDGMLDGHTDPALTPGVESANGLLGLGLSVAVGMAVAMRLKEEPRQRVFCILGDGELAEGNIWEAAMFAAHAGLDNLIAIVDYNKVQAKGLVHQTLRADAKTTSHFRVASSLGADGVVAGGLGVVMTDRQVLHLLVADFDASGVVGLDEVGVDPEPGLGPGGADVVDDGLIVG
jgi:transketolase